MNSKICVLDVLNGKVINTYNIPKEDGIEIMATAINTEKGYYYVLVREYIGADGKDVLYKLDSDGKYIGKSAIKNSMGYVGTKNKFCPHIFYICSLLIKYKKYLQKKMFCIEYCI